MSDDESAAPCLHCFLADAITQWMEESKISIEELNSDDVDNIIGGIAHIAAEFAVKCIDADQQSIAEFFRAMQSKTVTAYNRIATELNRRQKEIEAAARADGVAVDGDTIPEPESKLRH